MQAIQVFASLQQIELVPVDNSLIYTGISSQVITKLSSQTEKPKRRSVRVRSSFRIVAAA